MPPKRRNRKGDDDDFFASLATTAPVEEAEASPDVAIAETEESVPVEKVKTKPKKKKGGVEEDDSQQPPEEKPKGRKDGDSDSDDASTQPGSVISKKGKKKKKKGRYDDSDGEPEAVEPVSSGVAGKKKKKNAKGKRGMDSDSDSAQPAAEQVQPVITSKKEKRSKAKANKGKRGKAADSDSDDPLAIVNKLAAMSDSDEEDASNTPSNTVHAQLTAADISSGGEVVEDVAPVDNKVLEEVVAVSGSTEEQRAAKAKGRMSKAERKKTKHTGATIPVIPAAAPVAVVAEAQAPAVSVIPSAEQPQVAAEESVGQYDTVVMPPDAAPVVADAPAVEVPAAAPTKAKKKSKLELKLEAAKKAKEEAEAKKKAEIADAPTATEAAKVADGVSKISIADKKDKPTGVKEKSDGTIVSTMFGDDVFSEHVVHKKEIKYDRAALQASADGAQFAVSQSVVNPNDPQWLNALDVIIPNFSISAHNKELFYNAELNIAHGRRYGLVGPNGAGKSTLLKMISAGELKVPPRVDYLYVEQEVLADGTRAVDAVLKADKERWSLIQEEKTILASLANKADEAKDVRLGEIYAKLDAIGASAAEGRARRILFGLGFDAEMQVRPTQFFSGGWRMRIALARALFIEPTLLMLDEPTNHLDLNAVIWLDDYLQKWKKTVLIVSHDQDFLNSVCDEILHLQDKKLCYYKGNYDSFKEQETIVKKQRQKEWEKQERKLRELKSKGSSKAGAEKSMIKSKAREPGARAARKAEAANLTSGIESAETKIELLKRPKDYTVQFSFPTVAIVNPPILEVRDVTFQYGPRLPILFKDLNFGLDMGSRVCIVGPNGSGKSTILKLITGEINPEIGDIRRNPRLRVGVYNQHFMDRLPMDEDAVTYIRRMFNEETYQSARNILGRYGLEGHAHTIPIRDLSGGQKARVVFVELSLMAPHLLFLDEPTNNLDIESIDALCDALQAYNGGVVLVSHDARLIETTDCQLWVVEDQNVTPWESGFAGYRAHLLRKLEEQLSIIIAGSGERPV